MLLCLLGVMNGQSVIAQQNHGNYYIRNFDPREFKAGSTCWEITQGHDGRMYFGISGGLLIFDGKDWRSVMVKNNTTVRSMDTDSTGRVYLGAKAEFGYLEADSLGLENYVSLSTQLPRDSVNFPDVWNTYCTKDGVFFLTFQKVYRWYNGELTVHFPGRLNAHLGFVVRDDLYLITKENGVKRFNGAEFESLPSKNIFRRNTIFGMLEHKENEILMVSRKTGLFTYNPATGDTTNWRHEFRNEIKSAKSYHATTLRNGNYAIATLNKGVYIFKPDGGFEAHLHTQNGLISDNIKYLYEDYDGGLWLGTSAGIARAEATLPLTTYSSEHGLKGIVRAVRRHRETLYVATGNGLFYLDENPTDNRHLFLQIEGMDMQVWDLELVNGRLLAATSEGLFDIRDKTGIRFFETEAIFDIHRAWQFPGRLYLASKRGFIVMSYIDGDEQLPQLWRYYRDYPQEMHFMTEDIEGNVWVVTGYDFLVRIDHSNFSSPDSVLKYDIHAEGLGSEDLASYSDETHLYISTRDSLVQINRSDFSVEVISSIDLGLDSLAFPFRFIAIDHAENGSEWLMYILPGNVQGFMRTSRHNGKLLQPDPTLLRVNEVVSHAPVIYHDKGNTTWLGGNGGVVRYDHQEVELLPQKLLINFRKIKLGNDSVLHYGDILPDSMMEIAYVNNDLYFSFALADYTYMPSNRYQWCLSPFEEGWSDWSELNFKEYTNLPFGNYTFKVRGQNVYGQVSDTLTLAFSILPPWYRTWWAYALYVLGLLLLLYIGSKIMTRRFNKARRKLEYQVQERTMDLEREKRAIEEKNHEILSQKEFIEETNKLLATRNRDITDSLQYAKRIQKALLPDPDRLKRDFGESFVFYAPQSIVSGDFYWYDTVGDVFVLACADCTGHGVPGALMSMICTMLVEKVIKDKEINSPEDALGILDTEVVRAMSQQEVTKNVHTHDGMDIGILAIHNSKLWAQYAGAYRPLFLIRNDELRIYKGDRCSVGGVAKDKSFTGNEIDLLPGDVIYLFSDGYADQFGGPDDKKFKSLKFKRMLLDIHHKSMDEQYEIIKRRFENWKGNGEQSDDVLVIGLRVG